MKFHLLSDCHLEFGAYPTELFPDADYLLLAGDITVAARLREDKTDKHALKLKDRTRRFFDAASKKYKRVFYTPGNHEYYHDTFEDVDPFLWKYVDHYHNVMFLQNGAIPLEDDVLVLGATLWTDFNNNDPHTRLAVQNYMNDYQIIAHKGHGGALLVEDTYQAHLKTRDYLVNQIQKHPDKKIVIMTHMAPSRKSTHPRYRNAELVNGGYSSDLERVMLDNVKLWVHGHTHEQFDYKVGETRVVANPRGYIGHEFVDDKLMPKNNPGLVLDV